MRPYGDDDLALAMTIETLEALLAKATPGPWRVAETDMTCIMGPGKGVVADTWSTDNAALIVALRDVVPTLIEQVRTLTADLDEARPFERDCGELRTQLRSLAVALLAANRVIETFRGDIESVRMTLETSADENIGVAAQRVVRGLQMDVERLRADLAAMEAEMDRLNALSTASVKKDTDALLRASLGQEMYNRLWGPELEQLGQAVDVVFSELERLRTVIRTGGAMYRAERSVMGIPGGIDPDEVIKTPVRVADLLRQAAVLMRASKRGEVQAHVKDGDGWIELTLPEHRPAPNGPTDPDPDPDPCDVALDEILHIVGQSYHSGEMRDDIRSVIERCRERAKSNEEGNTGVDVRRVRDAGDVAEGLGVSAECRVPCEQPNAGGAPPADGRVLGEVSGRGPGASAGELSDGEYAIECEGCGVLSPIVQNEDDVVDAAVDAGWEVDGTNEDDQDRCSACRADRHDQPYEFALSTRRETIIECIELTWSDRSTRVNLRDPDSVVEAVMNCALDHHYDSTTNGIPDGLPGEIEARLAPIVERHMTAAAPDWHTRTADLTEEQQEAMRVELRAEVSRERL